MSKLILPGLIDPHVHLRDLGQEQKEDFYTGTCAALAGGFTTILDMPNNKIPITTRKRLNEKISIAKKKIVCDLGFYFGSLGDNLEEFEKVRSKTMGLKLYLNETTGNFLVDEKNLEKIFLAWSQSISLHSNRLYVRPVLVHAEEKTLEAVITVVQKTRVKTHVCHLSSQWELKKIIKAKERNLPITCGVTPHHLFLTEKDAKKLGPFGKMKPPLKSKKDIEFLWKNLKYIDCVESDHAPHTIGEKQSDKPPFGVPGLETTLPLLLTAVHKKRLTIEDILRLCFESPKKIFAIKTNKETKLEIDFDKSYIIDNKFLHTKCSWSPFNGWEVKGKIERVYLRGQKVFEKGTVLVKAGNGKIIKPQD